MHTIFGLQVHFKGDFAKYFLYPDPAGHWLPIRYDAFGIHKPHGLVAAPVLVVVLAPAQHPTVDSVQRWAYIGTGLVLVHGQRRW